MTQPSPTPNDREHIADLVCADIQERKRVGIERYSTALQAGNGRDALLDAYEEALDKAQYLKQALVERREERAAMSALIRSLPVCDVCEMSPATNGYSGEEICSAVRLCDEHRHADSVDRPEADALRAMLALMAGWPKEMT